MNHDPLCYLVGYDSYDYMADVCVNCKLIRKVRADERRATVESAVYAAQFGAVPELVQLLSRLYESPEVHMEDKARREAAAELTRLAQEMGMIP